MDTCQAFFDEQIDNLYRLVHKSENLKIKIQTILFIFQILQSLNALTDRYFRLLYTLLFLPDIFTTSLNEIFFDLIFFSLKEDSSIVRVKSFVKRILQSAIF